MFYVLASHNTYALERQFKTLPKRETTVIINTLDKDFEKFAQEYCWKEKIRCITTESDGTAATGKNKFLEIFEDDNVPYAVLIDGDDYLTHRGVRVYKELAQREDAPDAVGLLNQVAWTPFSYDTESLTADPDTLTGKCQVVGVVTDWDKWSKGQHLIDSGQEVTPYMLNTWKTCISLLRKGMGCNQMHCRVTFMSRKVLQYRFPKIKVGEETIFYLLLKGAYEKNKLNLVHLKETNPTYIYDARISGIANRESQERGIVGYMEWLSALTKELQKLNLYTTQPKVLEI